MYNQIFLHHSDPLLRFNEKQMLSHINMHALLLDESIIQDNFLISNEFYNLYKLSPGFSDLFSYGILNVAIRNHIDLNMNNLRIDLYDKIQQGRYIPFEPQLKHGELYLRDNFIQYLTTINDKISHNRTNLKVWAPIELGKNLRESMRTSAENGTAGFNSKKATQIFKAIDQSTEGNGHSRSLYYDFAKKNKDDKLEKKIQRWVNLNYLRNLPNTLSIGSSIPNKVTKCLAINSDPFQINKIIGDSNHVGDINASFLNPEFLINLSPEGIMEIRQSSEFKEYQDAIRTDKDKEEISRKLIEYLIFLSQEAFRYNEPYGKRIRVNESIVKAKLLLQRSTEGLSLLIKIFDPTFAISSASEVLSFVISRSESIEEQIKKDTKMSKAKLDEFHFEKEVRSATDIYHHFR